MRWWKQIGDQGLDESWKLKTVTKYFQSQIRQFLLFTDTAALLMWLGGNLSKGGLMDQGRFELDSLTQPNPSITSYHSKIKK